MASSVRPKPVGMDGETWFEDSLEYKSHGFLDYFVSGGYEDFIFAYAAISTSSSATISITLVLTSSVFFKFNLLSFPNFSKPAGRESLPKLKTF